MPPGAAPPRPALTHFLCLPLVTPTSRPQLRDSLAAFHADATSASSYNVPEASIRPVGTLHLTLGVMSFPRNDGLDRAEAVLRALKPRDILASVKAPVMPGVGAVAGRVGERGAVPTDSAEVPPEQRLSIALRGLQTFQNAARASVLYAPPSDPEGVLQRFCEEIRVPFQEAGLVVEEERPLALHATIVNTIYVKKGGLGHSGRSGGANRRRNERLTIDARGMLDRYEDYVWMESVRVEKIAICKMGAQKVVVDGEEDEAYEVIAEVDI